MKFAAKLLACAALVIFVPLSLPAQGQPQWSFYGGYVYERPENAAGIRFNANGWTVGPQYNLSGWLGVGASVTGWYASPQGVNTSNYAFLFGPTLTLPTHSRWVPFGMVNLGVDHNVIPIKSDNSFEVAFGGGLDYRLGRHWNVRLAQLQDAVTFFHNSTPHTFVYSGGIVFNFGEVAP